MSRPLGYVDANYLQKIGDLLRPNKEYTYTLMHIQPGQTVLDVGCGTGIDTVTLAGLVGSGGQVVGVDYDADMLTKADQRAQEAGVSAWVKHQKEDVTQLPFEAGKFDSGRSERVFQHLHDPEKALAEMIRVTKSGGWVVNLDADWGTLSVNTSETDLERRLIRFYTEKLIHNGYSSRKLPGMFKRQGLTDMVIEGRTVCIEDLPLARLTARMDLWEQECVAQGALSQDELERWQASLEQASASGNFFMSITGIMIAGCKP